MANRYGYCHLCGRYGNLDRHHVYGGGFRKKSERYGMVCYLCRNCHNAVHFSNESKNLMLRLRKEFQLKFMKKYPNKDFMKEFGRNYLDDQDECEEGFTIDELTI